MDLQMESFDRTTTQLRGAIVADQLHSFTERKAPG